MSAKQPSALIIPFGKHKGATVAELLERDPNAQTVVTLREIEAEIPNARELPT